MATLKNIVPAAKYATNSPVIANSGWGTGTRGIIGAVGAFGSGGTVTVAATGGGVTWTVVDDVIYGSRRDVAILESDGTPNGGDITVTVSSSAGSFAELICSIEEVAQFDAADLILTTSASAPGSDAESISAPALSDLVNDEIVYAICGVEDAGSDLISDDGVLHTPMSPVIVDGTDVRRFLAIDASTDTAPGFSWTGSCRRGMISAKISDGVTGTHDGGGGSSVVPSGLQTVNRGINSHRAGRLGGLLEG